MEKIRFAIIKKRRVFYLISAAIIIAGLVSLFTQGFNLDTDFTGGTAMTINIGKQLDRTELEKIQKLAGDAIGFTPSVQKTGEGDKSVVIKTKELDSEQRTKLFSAVKDAYGLQATQADSIENISATIGKELRSKAVLSIVIAAILMLFYIWIRFEFRSGLSAIIALLHDVAIVIAVYTIFRIPVNSNFIAVMLTILGYSINATIIVFDRVRENRRNLKAKEAFEDTAERSIWQTATRQLNTTLTTLFTIGMVYILGVTSVRNFALPLIIGIAAGLYSSMFISCSVWVTLKNMKIGDKGAKVK